MWKWLESTRVLQEDSFGVEYATLVDDELADYLTWNATALSVELAEFLQETGWKPWVKNRGWVNRDAAADELIDIAHFLANMACAIGMTDEEWVRRYQMKQEVNAARQSDGYTGIKEDGAT